MKTAFLSFLALGGVFARCAGAVPVPAERADDFVDSIGVCTHWGYLDTPYGNFDKASVLLGELGVRHIRDGLHPRERELFERYGIKTTAIVGPQTSISAQLADIQTSREFLDAIEGPNEVDIFPANSLYKGQVFPEGARLFQNDIYAALKGEFMTQLLPVIAPSTARAGSNRQLAPLSSLDYRVMHSYAGGQKPSNSLESDINNNTRNSAQIQGKNAVLKPIIVTESGYHNALGANLTLGGVQPGISEDAGAKYFPRHFAEYFNAGIARTFTYEFLNEFPDEQTNAEANFGLVRRDFTPKPAYTALKNLISMLDEAKWNSVTKTWDKPNPTFKPRALDIDLSGDTKDIHSTLLEKADGTYYLLLWREVSSFDTKTQKPIENPPASVTINVASSEEASAFRVRDNETLLMPATQEEPNIPLMGDIPLISRLSANRETTAHTVLSLQVPDEIVVVRITPKGRRNDIIATRSPVGLSVQTTGTTATLSWESAEARDAKGYFVSRLGSELGYIPKSTAEHTTFTESGLDPATGYTYSVREVDRWGNISRPVTVVAMTKDESPDLVVTNVALVTGENGVGNDAHFEATIENRGNAATSGGVTHGVAFSVDGEFVAWSDSFAGPLAPGAKITVRSNNGPKGTATWRVTTGKHTLHAQVDDVNRITESNEENNGMDAVVTR